MKTSRKLMLLLFLTMLPILVSSILLYSYYKFWSDSLLLGLYQYKKEIIAITSSFAFTLLGFLAATLTLFFTVFKSDVFIKYDEDGYLGVLLWHCGVTIISLSCTFILSLLAFSKYHFVFSVLLVMVCTNIFQFAVIVIAVTHVIRRAVQ